MFWAPGLNSVCFPESDQRRVLVVYVFRWAQVVFPGGAVAVPSRCGRIENLDFPKENQCFCTWTRPKGVRAGAGTLIHPRLDKIFTKWVAIKDFGAFVPGIDAESRRGSF